jgi:AraC-like DNA-binding protein
MKANSLLFLFLLIVAESFSQITLWEDSASVYLSKVRTSLPTADSLQMADADKAELYAQRSDNDSLLTMAWYYKGILYYYAGFHEASNEYYSKAMQRPEAITNPTMQYGILNNIGINYDLLGKPDISLEFYHRALQVGEAQDNYRGMGQVKINLGRLYRVTKDFEKSQQYLQDALAYFQSVKDTFYTGLAYQNIASLLADKGVREAEVLDAFDQAGDAYRAINYQFGLAELYHNLALYYQKHSNDMQLVADYYRKALEVSRQAGTHANSATLILGLARIAFESGDYQEAERHALESLRLSTLQNIPRERNSALKLLVQIYLALHEKEKGTEAYLSQVALADSIFNSEKTKSFNELSILHDLKYKNQQILNQQLELDNSRLFATWLKSLLGASILLIVLILLFYRFRARKLRQQYVLNRELLHCETQKPADDPGATASAGGDVYPGNIGHIYKAIINYFAAEKPYTDAGLSIAALAEALNTNQNYISRAINEHAGMNFYQLLNKFRTGEAMRLIEQNNAHGLTLEQIMYKAGFRSRSVFNDAFKKFAGMTPGQFQRFARESKGGFRQTIPLN